METLKSAISNWTDWDVATFYLGRCLGVFEGDFAENKKIICTNNPVGNALVGQLYKLAKAGIIEYQDEKFKWVQ